MHWRVQWRGQWRVQRRVQRQVQWPWQWLTAATLLVAVLPCNAQVPDWSLAAQQRLFGASSTAVEAQWAQRRALLEDGERRLASGDVAAAQARFDQAALMLHAPDTEALLVRSYMQAGDYRRALAFGAHAAGAHRREWPAGQALYVWLLQIGGQGVVARRLLDDALALAPDDAALLAARSQLATDWPRADGLLQQLPLRMAPYAVGDAVPAGAQVVGSGLLLATGDAALVPASVLGPPAVADRPIWLRNGLGQTVQARRAGQDESLGLVHLRLAAPLPITPLATADREPFAGSPGYMVEYAPASGPAAAWPLLRQGFFARPGSVPGPRLLGIPAPAGPRGGPVFNAAGHLAGMAVTAADGTDRLLPLALLAERFPALALTPAHPAHPAHPAGLPASAALAGPQRADADAVYEQALRHALQVLVSP